RRTDPFVARRLRNGVPAIRDGAAHTHGEGAIGIAHALGILSCRRYCPRCAAVDGGRLVRGPYVPLPRLAVRRISAPALSAALKLSTARQISILLGATRIRLGAEAAG